MHTKLDDVLNRQRSYDLRDWLIGIGALALVLVHLVGFSSGAWLPAADAATATPEATPAELIHQHTSEVCGEKQAAAVDLSC